MYLSPMLSCNVFPSPNLGVEPHYHRERRQYPVSILNVYL
jgi:hypothetical protein